MPYLNAKPIGKGSCIVGVRKGISASPYPLHGHGEACCRRLLAGYGATSGAITWTIEEKDIVRKAVVKWGSNHADTIFELYSAQLHPQRTYTCTVGELL